MKHTQFLISALMLALTLPIAAIAADDTGKPASASSTQSTDVTTAMATGEVKKIDKDAGKITVKHGPLANLEMPAMTMVFRVKDPAMLDQVKPGDKIHFIAEKVGGALTITKVESAK